MFIIGYPTPPRNVRAVAGSTAALINCNVHGNEPSSRRACDHGPRARVRRRPAPLDILSSTTVLIVPTINGDGRAANTRQATGQDLNRDYSLIRQPETFAFVEMMRDYRPEAAFDGHEFGNSQAGDLPVLPPRHLNVAQSIHDESKSMIEDWLYGTARPTAGGTARTAARAAARSGSARRTILRNTMGLKSVVGSLLEARSTGGTTRPNETTPRTSAGARLLGHLHVPAVPRLPGDQTESPRRSRSRSRSRPRHRPDRVPGSCPIPAFPAPHPGEPPPDSESHARTDPRSPAVRLRAQRAAVLGAATGWEAGGRPPRRSRFQGSPPHRAPRLLGRWFAAARALFRCCSTGRQRSRLSPRNGLPASS